MLVKRFHWRSVGDLPFNGGWKCGPEKLEKFRNDKNITQEELLLLKTFVEQYVEPKSGSSQPLKLLSYQLTDRMGRGRICGSRARHSLRSRLLFHIKAFPCAKQLNLGARPLMSLPELWSRGGSKTVFIRISLSTHFGDRLRGRQPTRLVVTVLMTLASFSDLLFSLLI